MAITESRTGWVAPTFRAADVEAGYEARRKTTDDGSQADPLIDEPKWPAWKVTVAVVVFCSAFWAGIGYVAVRLLG